MKLKICKKHGEISEENITKNNRCIFCIRGYSRKWKEANREKHRASAGLSRKLNRQRANEWRKKDFEKNPDKYRKWAASYRRRKGENRNTEHIIRRIGITAENYENMRIAHNNKCAICKKEETRKGRTPGTIARLCVDHCHLTQRVRGLICARCNLMLSYACDSSDIMESAAIYLKERKDWRDN